MSTAVAERPATVTIAPGVTVNSNMTPEERSAVIRTSMGLAPVQRETLPVNNGFHTPATVSRMQEGERELARAPREDGAAPAGVVLADKPAQDALGRWFAGLPTNEQGTVKARYVAASRALQAGGWLEQTATGELIAHTKDEPRPGQHAGMIAPTPEALERGNSGDKLAAFDAEMRAKGFQKPLDGNLQRDERTGIMVDVAALERAHELYRSMTPAEREAERADYHSVLEQIYAGKLGLADMEEDGPSGEQPRDAQGRYYTPSPHSPEQWEQGHASVTDANGFIRDFRGSRVGTRERNHAKTGRGIHCGRHAQARVNPMRCKTPRRHPRYVEVRARAMKRQAKRRKAAAERDRKIT